MISRRQHFTSTPSFFFDFSLRVIQKLLSPLRSLLHSIQIKLLTLFSNDQNYGIFFGNDNTFLLILKNLILPRRIITRILYGQLIPLPAFLSLKTSCNRFDVKYEKKHYDMAQELREKSYTVLPDNFSNLADHILENYKDWLGLLEPTGNYRTLLINKPDQVLTDLLFNEDILKVFALIYKGQPYLRSPANLNVTYPNIPHTPTKDENIEMHGFNIGWHYDTINMLQFTLLLNDVSPEGTHMQVAEGLNKTNRNHLSDMDYYYSDEYAENHFKVFSCSGKKGTVILFDSNTPHRLKITENSLRLDLKVMYTPGNNNLHLEASDDTYKLELSDDIMKKMSEFQKEAARYLM